MILLTISLISSKKSQSHWRFNIELIHAKMNFQELDLPVVVVLNDILFFNLEFALPFDLSGEMRRGAVP